MLVLQTDMVANNQSALKLYRQLIIRTEFILQQDKNLDEEYVSFLKEIMNDPYYFEFKSEIQDDISLLEVSDNEIEAAFQSMIPNL